MIKKHKQKHKASRGNDSPEKFETENTFASCQRLPQLGGAIHVFINPSPPLKPTLTRGKGSKPRRKPTHSEVAQTEAYLVPLQKAAEEIRLVRGLQLNGGGEQAGGLSLLQRLDQGSS